MKKICLLLLIPLLFGFSPKKSDLPLLKVAENHRFLMTEDGDPFFWLGDTGWLLLKKLDRQEAAKYLTDRKEKGYNVIQVMLIHDINDAVNCYGDSAISNKNVAEIMLTKGTSPENADEYDYWDHVDYVVQTAAEKGIYMAMVPIWGSNVKLGAVSSEEAAVYASFLGKRYKDFPNVIWMNGGDIKGTDSSAVWQTIGNEIKAVDPNHLMTFHPFGRTMSSEWFGKEKWLDFNMFQSGHRRYNQDDTERCFGEDNWRYVNSDYNIQPAKPTIDGEPSYEHIPQGLHDSSQPRWNAADSRRYAYWSVFAGACGHTYGHSSIMQFYSATDTVKSYDAKIYWETALDAPGGNCMQYLKELMLSKPFFSRIPDQSMIVAGQGEKYDYLVATRGPGYAFVYSYTAKSFSIDGSKIASKKLLASWFNPRNGEITIIDTLDNSNNLRFDPPGEIWEGNDWVLVLEATD